MANYLPQIGSDYMRGEVRRIEGEHRRNAATSVTPSAAAMVVAPFDDSPKWGKFGQHHRPYYDDYTVAKLHIMEALGDISELRLFGRQVMVAAFVKPAITPGGIITPVGFQMEDWWQGKVAMLVGVGPAAFSGDASYLAATYGDAVPKFGDWVFLNANAGITTSICGEGAKRPQGQDHLGRTIELFKWGDGWPCRIVNDDQLIGWAAKPHHVV